MPDDFKADINLHCTAAEEILVADEEAEEILGAAEEAEMILGEGDGESDQKVTESSDQDSVRCSDADDLNPKTFAAHEVCGYYEQGESREDMGRIVGGKKVKKLSMFPWQLSLSSTFLGLYYQHRFNTTSYHST